MDFTYSPFVIPIIAIVGWFAYSIVRTVSHARVRELEVRERIAMIERGLVPPPEKDPTGFDRAMRRYDRMRDDFEDRDWDYHLTRRAPVRYRSLGVTLMGVGFGLMLLITLTGGTRETGIGVGGFLVILGVAFFINGMMAAGEPQARRSPPPNEPPSSS